MREHSSRNFICITLAVLALATALSQRDKSRTTRVRSGLISWVTYPEAKPQHHVFGDLAAVVDIFHIDLTTHGKTEKLVAGAVQPNFFQMIGVEPVLGRTFRSGEDAGNHVVVLSYALWQRRFDSATGIVGRNITLEGELYRVIGILPRDFTWNNHETDVWVPCTAKSGGDPGSFISQVRWSARRSGSRFEPEI
jgi:MacB-like periplasmic core domain